MKQDVIYEKVAERCSSFNAISKDSYTNRANDTKNVSCKNCSHFEKEHCVVKAKLGNATLRLMKQKELVDFAKDWIEKNRT